MVHIDVSPEQQNGKILSAESQDSGEPPRRKRGRPRKNPAVERIVIKVNANTNMLAKKSRIT